MKTACLISWGEKAMLHLAIENSGGLLPFKIFNQLSTSSYMIKMHQFKYLMSMNRLYCNDIK